MIAERRAAGADARESETGRRDLLGSLVHANSAGQTTEEDEDFEQELMKRKGTLSDEEGVLDLFLAENELNMISHGQHVCLPAGRTWSVHPLLTLDTRPRLLSQTQLHTPSLSPLLFSRSTLRFNRSYMIISIAFYQTLLSR